ncbi:MAG: biopolymer transporter ExbD [Treponema sp.]|nr:biopolymer transporter ExbD [Treponema sp.]
MKLKARRRNAFVESCAASDLAFQLIIYFLVIAGFSVSTGYLMTLPAKNSTRMILREDLLRFEINENGNVIHNGELLNIPDARKIISQARDANPDIAVILTINWNAVWQKVVSFVEIVQDLKINSFSFTMQKENQ